MEDLAWYGVALKFFVGVVAIANPLGVIPIYLSLAGDRPLAEQRRIGRQAAMSVIVVLLASVWVGDAILGFFGIGVPAFRVGGGLLILLMAISMLHARQSHVKQNPAESDEAGDRDSIAVVPLAIPLMAGPGAISLVIADATAHHSALDRLGFSVAVILLGFVVWVVLRLADPIGRRLGVTGLNIATRIMGLLLSAIGVQMITAGLVKLLPGLAG